METSLQRWLRLCAMLAGALVLGMLAIFVVTGIGQDPLQYVHPAAEYRQLLLRNPPMLRAAIGLDNLFIVAYCGVFVLMVLRLWRDGAPRLLLCCALPLLLLLGLLDMVENLHFLAMLAGAEQGGGPGDAEIAAQALESMVKFHVSYLGLFLFGLAMPGRTVAERLLARLLLWVQWPLGVAIYVMPHAVAVPLVFVRFAFFLAAFALVSRLAGSSLSAPAAPAATGSGAPA